MIDILNEGDRITTGELNFYMKVNAKKIAKVGGNTALSFKNLALRNFDGVLKPKWLVFMVTDKCNSRCTHCSIWRQKGIDNPLTPEELEKTLSDSLFKDIREIINTGGEATLRTDLEEIFLAEHKALPKANLQLSTNALIPQRTIDLAKALLKRDIPLSIGISLDGVGEHHDKVRGVKGNFERVNRLVQELIKLKKIYKDKLTFVLGFTLSSLTVDYMKETQEYGKEIGVDVLVQWYNQANFYSNTERELPKTDKKLLDAVKSLSPSFIRESWLSSMEGKFIKFPCFAFHTFCVLKTNGDIVPCLNFFNSSAGNVREKTPTEIWKSKEAQKIRKTIKSCSTCLNQWGSGWSFESCTFPVMSFYLKNPSKLIKRFKERGIE